MIKLFFNNVQVPHESNGISNIITIKCIQAKLNENQNF